MDLGSFCSALKTYTRNKIASSGPWKNAFSSPSSGSCHQPPPDLHAHPAVKWPVFRLSTLLALRDFLQAQGSPLSHGLTVLLVRRRFFQQCYLGKLRATRKTFSLYFFSVPTYLLFYLENTFVVCH